MSDAKREAQKIASGFGGPSFLIESLQRQLEDAIERAERRGRIVAYRDVAENFMGDEYARAVIDWAYDKADRLERERK